MEYTDKNGAYKNTFYPVGMPSQDYVDKKGLIINPIYIKQRIKARHQAIIVINFEGVIGDFFKKNLIDISCPGFYLRPNAI